MSDPAPPPGPHARFPWAPALLCAASLAMVAWTWMRFSYCWDVRGHKFGPVRSTENRWPVGAYVVWYDSTRGRLEVRREGLYCFLGCNSGASRLTGGSIAGLIVGAFGTFVFTLHLGRWTVERKRRRRAATLRAPG